MNSPYSADQSPELSLAQTPAIPNVASGSSVTNMPTFAPPIPREQPSLRPYDIAMMGIDPHLPFDDLNLAGRGPLPAPPYETSSAEILNPPTFAEPDFSVPGVRPYNLTEPGIDQNAFTTSSLPDLTSMDHPRGLDILGSVSDPNLPDLSLYDHPNNLFMLDASQPDPLLPDLQHLTLTQEVHMEGRPAEMSSTDLGPDGDHDDDDGPMPPYKQEFMTPDMSTRERKMDTLHRGLKGNL